MKKPMSDAKREEIRKLGLRLKELRQEAGLSLSDTAAQLNEKFGSSITKGMIFKYECGTHGPSAATLHCLSCIFNVSVDYITGASDERYPAAPVSSSDQPGYCLRLYTSMTGQNTGTVSESETVLVPKSWIDDGRRLFAYQVTCNRFAPRYYNGDILIFQHGVKAKPGQAALVSIGNADATLYFVEKKRGGKMLTPLDPTLESRFYTTQEIDELPVKILGLCVQLRRQEFEL